MTEDYYETQAEAARNHPGLSIADGRFIDGWVTKAQNGDRHRVQSWARERRVTNKEKRSEVANRLNTLQDEFVLVRKRAERNEVGWQELVKVQRRLNSERIALEKVHQSLTASEASISQMEADPVAYMTGFYNRFPTLQDRRPNLANDLAENQRRRGVERLG